MDVAQFFRRLVRRPVGLIVVILLAVGAGYYGWSSTTVQYTSTGAVLVIPPGAGNPNATVNPFVNLDNNMAQLAVVLQTSAGSDDAHRAVQAASGSSNYTMTTVAGNESTFAQMTPQIVMQVTASTPDNAKAGANALIKYMGTHLQAIQSHAGVQNGQFADLQTPTAPGLGVPAGGSRMRSAIGYAGGVLIAGIIVLLLATAAAQALRGGRKKSVESPKPTETEPADPAPLA
jgi:hypothetical protein